MIRLQAISPGRLLRSPCVTRLSSVHHQSTGPELTLTSSRQNFISAAICLQADTQLPEYPATRCRGSDVKITVYRQRDQTCTVLLWSRDLDVN